MASANVEEPDHKFNTDNANDSQADHCQQLLDGISVRRGYSKITGPAQTCTHYVIDGEVVAEDDEDVETAGNGRSMFLYLARFER